MAAVATFTVPPHEFPLGTVFDELPGVEVKLERFVPGPDVVVPYFWVRGAFTDDVEAAFSNHPGVRDIRFIDSIQDEHLLRVEWEPSYTGILTSLAELEIPLLEAIGTNEQWTFEVRGEARSDIADFQHLCRERDIPITLTALHALTPLETATEAALTDAQEEALVMAFERGYFDSPRDVKMEDTRRAPTVNPSKHPYITPTSRSLKRAVSLSTMLKMAYFRPPTEPQRSNPI